MNATPLQIGDRVEWMHCRSNGTSLGFSTREGKIVSFLGNTACVKQRNGRKQWVGLEDLTRDGEKNGVTKLFETLAGTEIPILGTANCTGHPLPSDAETTKNVEQFLASEKS